MPAPLTGQLALSASAQPLSATPVSATAYSIKAPQSNLSPCWVGPSSVTSSNGYQLDPGDTLDYQRNDQHGQGGFQVGVGDFYGTGSSGDKIVWLASP